jgi:glycosyltransferase involved in cell wall biosynthesis
MININMTPKKILYLITKSNFGGAQKYVFELACGAVKENFAVSVALGGEGILKDKLLEKGIRVISLPSLKRDLAFGLDVKNFLQLIKIFKEESPDIIHLNSSKIGFLGALAGQLHNILQKKKIKIIFTGHGWAFNENRNWFSRKAILFAHWLTILLCDITIAVSEKTKNDIARLPFVSKKIRVIYNGIDEIDFKNGFEARQFLGKNISENVWIGSIAELHKNKGLDFLIEAFSKIANSYPDTTLVIIGEGEERKKLEEQISKLGLTAKIHLLGNVPDAKIYLKAFDIFMLTSRTEALPYAILEAGLAGLPIVASRAGGIPEIIEEEKNGLLVKVGNIKEISKKIEGLLGNPEKRESLGNSLKQKILIKFSTEEMFEKTFNIYNKFLIK